LMSLKAASDTADTCATTLLSLAVTACCLLLPALPVSQVAYSLHRLGSVSTPSLSRGLKLVSCHLAKALEVYGSGSTSSFA